MVSDVSHRYRDLGLMPLACGVEVDHTTIFGWVQPYAAEQENRPAGLRGLVIAPTAKGVMPARPQ
jgi:hypothetical protein